MRMRQAHTKHTVATQRAPFIYQRVADVQAPNVAFEESLQRCLWPGKEKEVEDARRRCVTGGFNKNGDNCNSEPTSLTYEDGILCVDPWYARLMIDSEEGQLMELLMSDTVIRRGNSTFLHTRNAHARYKIPDSLAARGFAPLQWCRLSNASRTSPTTPHRHAEPSCASPGRWEKFGQLARAPKINRARCGTKANLRPRMPLSPPQCYGQAKHARPSSARMKADN